MHSFTDVLFIYCIYFVLDGVDLKIQDSFTFDSNTANNDSA